MIVQPPPPVSRAFRKLRKEFEAARHAELKSMRKGTTWRKQNAWLFCERNGVFIDAFFIAHIGEERTWIQVSMKPMALDSIFWRITGMPENERPLSLRANGAFACRGLPVLEQVLDDNASDVSGSATALFGTAEAGAEVALQTMNESTFSELLEKRAQATDVLVAEWFGPTYVTALILDNRLAEARHIIHEHKQGLMQARMNFTFVGAEAGDRRDFFDLALEYISTDRTP